MENKNGGLIFLSFLLFLIVFSPEKQLISSMPAFRAEDMVAVLSLIVIILRFSLYGKYIINDKTITILFLMIWSSIMSIVFFPLFYDGNLILRDIMIVFQIAKYLILYVIVRSIIIHEEQYEKFFIIIIAIGALAALVGVLQYLNLLKINTWFSPLYIKDERLIETLKNNYSWKRAQGISSTNPNFYGYILNWFYSFALAIIVIYPRDKYHISFLLTSVFLILLAVLFTLSRTAISLLGPLSILAFFLKKRVSLQKILIFIILMSVFINIFLYFFKDQAFERRITIENVKGSSYSARKRDFILPIKEMIDNPELIVFGKGPSKTSLRTDSHNGFTWYLTRFGLLGLSIYIILLVYNFKLARSCLFEMESDAVKVIALATMLVIINWSVSNFSLDLFKIPQSMSLNIFMLALLSRQVESHHEKSAIEEQKGS